MKTTLIKTITIVLFAVLVNLSSASAQKEYKVWYTLNGESKKTFLTLDYGTKIEALEILSFKHGRNSRLTISSMEQSDQFAESMAEMVLGFVFLNALNGGTINESKSIPEQLEQYITSGCAENGKVVQMKSNNPNKQFAIRQESTKTPGKFRYLFIDGTVGMKDVGGKFYMIPKATWGCSKHTH
jgi:hypothetical protein